MSEGFDDKPGAEGVPAPDGDPRAWPVDEPPAETADESDDGGDGAEVDTSERFPEQTPPAEPVPAAPETGDLVIDAALRDLADAPSDDLDAQIDKGEQVQRTLQGRLSDLGG